MDTLVFFGKYTENLDVLERTWKCQSRVLKTLKTTSQTKIARKLRHNTPPHVVLDVASCYLNLSNRYRMRTSSRIMSPPFLKRALSNSPYWIGRNCLPQESETSKMPFEIRHFVETIFYWARKDRSTHSYFYGCAAFNVASVNSQGRCTFSPHLLRWGRTNK